jgi:hypothetical protein
MKTAFVLISTFLATSAAPSAMAGLKFSKPPRQTELPREVKGAAHETTAKAAPAKPAPAAKPPSRVEARTAAAAAVRPAPRSTEARFEQRLHALEEEVKAVRTQAQTTPQAPQGSAAGVAATPAAATPITAATPINEGGSSAPTNPANDERGFEPVAREQVPSLAHRLKLVEKLLRRYGRAYDYRVFTNRELQQLLTTLERGGQPAPAHVAPAAAVTAPPAQAAPAAQNLVAPAAGAPIQTTPAADSAPAAETPAGEAGIAGDDVQYHSAEEPFAPVPPASPDQNYLPTPEEGSAAPTAD